ncbi:hypothetical protein [Labilithrix luteola]|uniref:hypothetical protein n=1 Tax=Labilithrix luteola TaxID=1391654 RepID=UPI0011BA5352|nr:hypothetical protein [Labilithrix luteola]
MNTLEIRVRDGRRDPVVVKVEKRKVNLDAPLEYCEEVRGEVLVLPAPEGRVTGVFLCIGPRRFPFVVVDGAFPCGDTFYTCFANAEEKTLTLSPYPPLPDALVAVEYDDGR